MIAYPTNALVEDQMSRLRRAIHALAGEGVPLWFGRLTGASLGTVRPPNPPSAAGRTAKEVRLLVEDYDAMRHAPVPEGESLEDRLALFTDPRRNEMVVRWDMVQAPPDILVTNFSMLNALLMRDVEANMFACTRAWLEESPEHVFTLVVDELHLHRGTAGSEVGMVLRNLLARIGLAGDSPQLRVIGTSASLSDDPFAYLEQFFGVPRTSFVVTEGEPRRPQAGPDLGADSVLGGGPGGVDASAQSLSDMVASACYDEETGRLRATEVPIVANRVFGTHPHARQALDTVLAQLAQAGKDEQKTQIRSHHFVRTMRGCGPAATRAAAARPRRRSKRPQQDRHRRTRPPTPCLSPSAESTSDRGRPAGIAAHECSSCSTATSAAT